MTAGPDSGGHPVLYHSGMSVCAAKVRMLLALKGIAWTGVELDLRKGEAQSTGYVRLNPGQLVPTLIDNGAVIIESNVILEYIDDRWADPPARPASAAGRAAMRLWMRQLDDGLHAAVGTLSVCIAFRHEFQARPPGAVDAWLAAMTDPARRARLGAALARGMDAETFAPAVRRYLAWLDTTEAALRDRPWLAGDNLSLADIAHAPYMQRLHHLGFGPRIGALPALAGWWARLSASPSFATGITAWLKPAALSILDRERPQAMAHIELIAAEGT